MNSIMVIHPYKYDEMWVFDFYAQFKAKTKL
jgi:hypothetical protein